MSNTVSVGDNNKAVVAGGNVNLTFTHVDSVPCSDPYCDQIIAAEKAKIRNGLCSTCYQSFEKESVYESIRSLKPFLALALLSLCVYLLQILVYAVIKYGYDIETQEPHLFAFWLGIIVLAPTLFVGALRSHRVMQKLSLKNKGKTQ